MAASGARVRPSTARAPCWSLGPNPRPQGSLVLRTEQPWVFSQVQERIPRRPFVTVPRLFRSTGAEPYRAELSQLHAELVNRQRMPVTELVSIVDVAGMEHLADYIF